MKIFTKTHVIYIKRKLRTCRIEIQIEKVQFIAKKLEKKNFKIFFSKGGPFDVGTNEKNFCDFSNFQKIFLKSGLNWT